MQTVTTIGLEAKSVFQVHGIDAEGNVIVRRQLKRRYVLVRTRSCSDRGCSDPRILFGSGADVRCQT